MNAGVWSLIIIGLVVLSVAVSGFLAVYSWSRISHPVSKYYGLLMTADSLWAAGYLCMILGGGGYLTEAGLIIKGFFSAVAGVAWLLFVSEYTGDSEWIPSWVWWVLTAESVAFGLLVAINPEGLVISEIAVDQFGLFAFPTESAGLITELQLLFSVGLVVSSLVLLGRFFAETESVYRYQALIILVIGTIVATSSVLFVSESRIVRFVDPTPILFNLQALGVGWALYRYDFLKLAPVVVGRFFREMNDPVLILSPTFVVVDYNAAAERLVEELEAGVPIAEFDDEGFRRMLQTVVDSSESGIEFTKLRTDGGHQQTYDIEETNVTDQFGITQGYVVVLRDITDRKRRERRLRKQNERLEEFGSIVSHDLRNPLSTAVGWTELTDRRLADEDPEIEAARDGLEQLVEAHDRMEELIEVLLTMAREGQTVTEPEPVDIGTCAAEAWATANTGDLELVIETERTVEADPARLRQAFENLFRNANDHGEASTVSVRARPDGFAIEDDGAGLAAVDTESLFQFGYSTDDDGTGIGLAVVKRIIEAHGWEITTGDSEAGGARFEVTTVQTP